MINNIALAGCGNVGTALLEILCEKQGELKEKYGFEYRVVLVSDLIRGVALNPEGVNLKKLLDEVRAKNGFGDMGTSRGEFSDMLAESGATVLAECTPTNLKTGEPGLSHIRAALSRGVSVTTTNKGPLAVAFDELTGLAAKTRAEFAYEGVVMSGTPLIDMIKNGLAGCTILGVEGILNGTTNFILTKMALGASYAQALEEAKSLGYAEADPTGDVEGWDAAVKVAILAKIVFGKDVKTDDIDRRGITHITQEQISDAKRRGFAVKLVAGINFDEVGMHCYVTPKEYPVEHPLSAINGATNAITLETDNLGKVTLIGAGAGRRETGQALLSDMIRMSK